MAISPLSRSNHTIVLNHEIQARQQKIQPTVLAYAGSLIRTLSQQGRKQQIDPSQPTEGRRMLKNFWCEVYCHAFRDCGLRFHRRTTPKGTQAKSIAESVMHQSFHS